MLADILIEECNCEAANRAQLVSLRLKPERFDKSVYQFIIDARQSAGRVADKEAFQLLLRSILNEC
jgi:hypothetical protein